MIDLKQLTRDELVARLAGIGQPAWQADEVRRFLFAKGVRTIASAHDPAEEGPARPSRRAAPS